MSNAMGREKDDDGGCGRSPGRRYPTRAEAEEAALTRRINVVNTKQSSPEGSHQVKGCDCGGFHIFTANQLQSRRRSVMRKVGGPFARGGTGRRS